MSRSVVITGVGAVTPLGVGARTLHERWSAGRSGIEDGLGRCDEFEAKEHLSVKEVRRSDRFTQLALTAADEALADAGWDEDTPGDRDRFACVIGTGIGGITTIEEQHSIMLERGPDKVSPLGIPILMANAASGVMAMKHGLRGQSFGTVSACAAGAHAIGIAARLIAYGDADSAVTGGTESTLTPLTIAGFSKMEALSKEGISRPFDRRRDGFVLGEGAGVLVLEEEEGARERGARILGRLAGYASTSDAYHLTAPEPGGRGAARAIGLALADAGLEPADVAYVNAHGTSTPLNDRAETEAIKAALGERASAVPVSSHEVRDRPPARGRRRGGGDSHPARAARPDRPADAELRGARRGPRPRLRARKGAAAAGRRRARGGNLERVRLRRPQRRALHRGAVSGGLLRASASSSRGCSPAAASPSPWRSGRRRTGPSWCSRASAAPGGSRSALPPSSRIRRTCWSST